jgi:protein-disulfide isomerase
MENTTQKTSKANFFLGFFIGMAAISVVGFITMLIIVFGQGQSVDLAAEAAGGAEQQQQQQQQPDYDPVPPINNDDYVFGKKDAKVVIIEYTDFECPYCARHYDTAKKIKETYGNKIAFVTRNYPLSFHPQAQKAAEASECAGEQGKFWQMYDVLFEANKAKNMSVDTWKAEAKKMGLNTKKFNDCLDSGKYAEKVADEMEAGAYAGVSGTPATFINGELISGALPFETFKQIIDQLLAE